MPQPSRLSDAFRTRLDAFTESLTGVADARHDALHGARVAARRLRELVPLLALEHHTGRKLSRRLKKITRRLGALRELDVSGALIAECERAGRCSPTAVNAVAAEIERARGEARTATVERLAAKMERLASRLERVCEHPTPNNKKDRLAANRASSWALDARMVRRAEQFVTALERAACVYAPAQLHDVRIALKKFRYAAELGHEIDGRRAGADMAMLKAGQDVLGRLHDLEELIARVRNVQASLSPPDLHTWRDLSALVRSLEDESRHLHARFVRIRPRLLGVAHRFEDARGLSRTSAATTDAGALTASRTP